MVGTIGVRWQWILGATLSCAAVLGGCGSGGATQAPDSGFLEHSERMTKDQGMPFQRTYWNKAYDSRAYTELYVAPVNTDYIMAQSFWEKANVASVDPAQAKKDIATVAEYTRQSFTRAAADDPNHRFTVVEKDKVGKQTLILELALVQLVPSKAVLNAIGYVTWIPTAVAIGSSTATGSQDTGKGVVAIEGRVRDGATGEILGMFADREHPATAIIDLKALNWWAPAKAIVDNWSKQLIALANRPPSGVVKDKPQFELMVW
jgi:hypothetical protein